MLIVYCGELWQGSTSLMRLQALRRLGHTVVSIDTTHRPQGLHGFIYRLARKAGRLIDASGANDALKLAVAKQEPNVVWIDKGLAIEARTLAVISHRQPTINLVHYSLDDMSAAHNQSRQYLEAISDYHLHVTNKSFNVDELRALGARAVLFVNNAFCPLTHRPQSLNTEDAKRLGGPVGFIGGFEGGRAEAIWFLVNRGVPVRVWGEKWGRGWKDWEVSHRHPLLKVEDRPLFGTDYAKAISSFDINLAFLRKLNRDLQTTRSVEIPACGGFMLAERTGEHQQLFQEAEEADFFSNHEEMLEKCQYYLAHCKVRAQIARAGRERCIRSDYSYDGQMHHILERLNGEALLRARTNSGSVPQLRPCT